MLLALSPLVWFAIFGAAGAAGLAAWWFSPYQKTLRALRAAPRVRVADAQEGQLVRIVGTLRAHRETLVSPLAARTCAHFDVLVEERVKSGKNSSWRTLFREHDSRDFVVEDESGRVIVDTGGLEVALVQDHHQRSGTFEDASPELEALLARNGHTSTGFFGMNRTLRYREGVLEPGERVSVLGWAHWEDDPEGERDLSAAAYRTATRKKRLVLQPSAESPVRASDDPKAL